MGQVLDRVRVEYPKTKDELLTYAGRLDPMATGTVLVLIGKECTEKDRYLGVNKEYTIEIVVGLESDTADILGVVTEGDGGDEKHICKAIQDLVGMHSVPYPAYSSKPVDGKPLWQWSREGKIPHVWPKTKLHIHTLELGDIRYVSGDVLVKKAIERINTVRGDFRQHEAVISWNNLNAKKEYLVIPVTCTVSGGSYMRSIPAVLKEHIGISSVLWSIHRSKIFI